MKKLIYIWIIVLALPVAVFGQSNELLEEAYLLRKRGEFKESAKVIDEAISTKKGAENTGVWHVRGFIYKDIYMKIDQGSRTSQARETAVESFKKSIELDTKEAYAIQSRKVLQFLAVSYFNDAIDIIEERDPLTVDQANDEYLKYKDLTLYLYPDTTMKNHDIEFYLAMSTVNRKIYEKDRANNGLNLDKQNDYLRLVLQLDPNNFSANYSLSVSHYNEGALNLEKLPEATGIADIYEIQAESMRSIEMALPFMHKAYEINPEKLEAVKGLKWIYFNLHREEESQKMEEEEKKLRGSNLKK